MIMTHPPIVPDIQPSLRVVSDILSERKDGLYYEPSYINFKDPVKIGYRDTQIFGIEKGRCFVCRSYRHVLTSVNICHTCILLYLRDDVIEKFTPDEIPFDIEKSTCVKCQNNVNILCTVKLCKICLTYKLRCLFPNRVLMMFITPGYKESNNTNMCCVCFNENIIEPGYSCLCCMERICKSCLIKLPKNKNKYMMCPICRSEFNTDPDITKQLKEC